MKEKLVNLFRKRSLRWILVCIALVCFSYYRLGRYLVISQIQLEISDENQWYSNEILVDLQERLNEFVGKKIWEVSLDDLLSILKADPHVHLDSAKLLRLLPNRFLVQIQVQKPLAVLWDSKGYVYPLSMEAQLLPALPLKQSPDLPILRGSLFFEHIQLRSLALQFLDQLPKEGTDLSRNNISEIMYSDSEKSLLVILSHYGKPIKIGRDLKRKKWKRIESVLQYLEQQNIQWRVIDARFSQKIVVSTTQAI